MEQEMTLDLKEIFEIIKKRLWLIGAITGVAVFICAILSFFIIPPTYEAKTSIIIGQEEAAESKNLQYNDVMMYQKLVKTYVAIGKSQVVMERAAESLGTSYTPGQVSNSISITPESDTQIIYIKAQSKEAEEALRIVNAHSEAFIEEAPELYPSGNVKIMDKAVLPKSPIKPRPTMNMAISFILGIMLSLGVIFLMEYLDNTIKTENDVNKYLGLPVIGVIPKAVEE